MLKGGSPPPTSRMSCVTCQHLHVNYFIGDICFTKWILCFTKRGICRYQTEQLTRPRYMFA